MKIKPLLPLSSLALLLMMGSSHSFADSCSSGSSAVQQRIKDVKRNVCNQVDTSVSLRNSPYVYVNPDQGCDLGFSMPGLPNIGASLGGFDSCKVLKAVTGEFVKEVNNGMQDAVDETLGKDTQTELSLEEQLLERIEQAKREEAKHHNNNSSSSNTYQDEN